MHEKELLVTHLVVQVRNFYRRTFLRFSKKQSVRKANVKRKVWKGIAVDVGPPYGKSY